MPPHIVKHNVRMIVFDSTTLPPLVKLTSIIMADFDCTMSGAVHVEDTIVDPANTTDTNSAYPVTPITDSTVPHHKIEFTDPWNKTQHARTTKPTSLVSPTEPTETDHVYDIPSPAPSPIHTQLKTPPASVVKSSKLGSFRKHTKKISAGLNIFQQRRGSGKPKLQIDTHTGTHAFIHTTVHTRRKSSFKPPPRASTAPQTIPEGLIGIEDRIKPIERTHSCPAVETPCTLYLKKYVEVGGNERSLLLPEDISACVTEVEELARQQYVACLKKAHSARVESMGVRNKKKRLSMVCFPQFLEMFLNMSWWLDLRD